ncbi:MAG: IS630 family transposase [Terriglobia bacterium]
MTQALPATAQGKTIEIWFQDEARVGQKGTLTRIWARRGTRPRAVRDTRYEWAYIFGAVCPQRSTGAALVMPFADSAAFNAHLREIAVQIAAHAHGVIVLDGAGWHTSQALEVPDNMTLVVLPPYAPELNPVENVWEYLRKNKLANRLHDDYDAIVVACCNAWNDLIQTPDRIASITQRTWANVS